MARAYLAPSLDNLFNEINARWPHRDRRTDGWYTNSRTSYGHNRNERGLVHAIDVDKDGIDPMYIVNHAVRGGGILWYIIWNRKLYSNTYKWKPRKYTGSNPHTDHLHIEIYHTTKAERYSGYWGIAKSSSGFGSAPTHGSGIGNALSAAYASSMNEGGRDYRPYLLTGAKALYDRGTDIHHRAGTIAHLRR